MLELQALLAPAKSGQAVRAVPGAGTEVPIWILGSSTFGAELAAKLGLPYAFASHFAPDALLPALDIYRRKFQPSKQLDHPYAMVGVNVVAADTEKKRAVCSQLSSSPSPTSSVARAANYKPRSTTSTTTGPRWSSTTPRTC